MEALKGKGPRFGQSRGRYYKFRGRYNIMGPRFHIKSTLNILETLSIEGPTFYLEVLS